jgi:alpha-tubulin suppressor-like RCC1 family protein
MRTFWHQKSHGGWSAQNVLWSADLQRSTNGGAWKTLLTHRTNGQLVYFGTASKPHLQPLHKLSAFSGSFGSSKATSKYRVAETIEWFRPSLTKVAREGSVTAIATYYSSPQTRIGDQTSCLGRIPTPPRPCLRCVYSWGDNRLDQLGNGKATQQLASSNLPTRVVGLTNIVEVSGGNAGGYALSASGQVYSWGSNNAGQLGDGEPPVDQSITATPVAITTLTNVRDVVGSSGYAPSFHYANGYAVKSDGTVWSWGSSGGGQLGAGPALDSEQYSDTPVQVSGLTSITEVAAGAYDGYALSSSGNVWAWGGNGNGQLGDGMASSAQPESNVPVQVSGLSNIIGIAGSVANGYAVTGVGTVYAWGDNSAGELGDGNDATQQAGSNVPVLVSGLSNVTKVVANSLGAYALTADGHVYAWGGDSTGQLGDGRSGGSGYSDTPTRVANLNSVVDIAGGGYLGAEADGYALTSDGSLYAWGSNNEGQLGDGQPGTTQPYSDVPVRVKAPNDVASLGAGTFDGYAVTNQ